MQLWETVSSAVAYLPWLVAYQTQVEGFLLRCVAQVAADAMAQIAKLPAQPAGMEMDFLFKSWHGEVNSKAILSMM